MPNTMRTNPLFCTSTLIVSLAVMLSVGCGSFPKESEAKTKASFPQSIERVQKAAADTLAATGFEIQKQEPGHLEGARPRKAGIFVGSGGEKVGVWLTTLTPDQTEVKVKTNTSFAGRAGQKNWDDEILAEMKRLLGK